MFLIFLFNFTQKVIKEKHKYIYVLDLYVCVEGMYKS